MTRIYFVRHAEPIHSWQDDRTRPLTNAGLNDSNEVTETLRIAGIDCFYSSPYKRSMDTILGCSIHYGKKITTDERLRERENGIVSNTREMIIKRWADFDYCEEKGESLNSVQKRNISAISDILLKEKGKNVVVATHGTALSTILHFYNPGFTCDDFFRIIDYMPYIIRLDFDGAINIDIEELLIIRKPYL